MSPELRVGLVVAAPVKRGGKRAYEDTRVVWVSKDGRVAEVLTLGKREERLAFARCLLRPAGHEAPEGLLL